MSRLLLALLFSVCTQVIAIPIVFNYNVPYTISSPGSYLVGENIGYTPSANTACIIVNSSGVILDLMGNTVTQVGGFGFTVTGIQVASGVSNVTIQNGSVNNFAASAISAASGISNLEVTNIEVNSCGQRGIEFVGSTASPIAQTMVNNCVCVGTCTVTSADNVVTFSNVNNLVFQDCIIAANGSNVITATFVGVKITNCQRPQITNVSCANNLGQFDARGFSMNNCSNGILTNCIVNGLIASGAGSNAQGFVLESNTQSLNTSSTGVTFQNCMVNNMTGTNNVDGFFTGSGCNTVMLSCIAQDLNVTNITGVVSGFRFVNCSSTNLVNCYALSCSAGANNTTASPLYAAHGFKFDTVTGISNDNCIANDIYAAPTGRSVGYFWIGSKGCTTTQCRSARVSVNFDLASSQAAGQSGNSVLQCVAQKPITSNYVNFANNSVTQNNAPTTLNGGANAFPWINFGTT